METKRFIGSDLNRLYARMRREFGPDAVIVRTRTLMREGADPLIEILAAPPEAEATLSLDFQRTVLQGLESRIQTPRSLTVGDLEDLAARETLLDQVEADTAPIAEAFNSSPAADETPSWLTGFVPNAPASPFGQELEEEALALPDTEPTPLYERQSFRRRTFELPPAEEMPLRPATFGRSTEAVPTRPSGADVDAPPIDLTSSRPRPRVTAPDGPGLSFVEQLVAAGLSPAAARIVHECASWETDLPRAIAACLEQRHVRYPDEQRTALITIQGAAGSGRTTALVRMALDCADAGREAILLAADTSHVGAREQIHAYAEAMGLNVADAFDDREVVRVANKARAGTCIFADLPAGPWAPPPTANVDLFHYLALPAHWGAEALQQETAPFITSTFAGCILTNHDRATNLSPVISTVVESRLGLAFLSSGRDVSTGIEVADPLTLASGVCLSRTGDRTNGRAIAIA